MKKLLLLTTCVVVFCGLAAAQAEKPDKIQVLIITGQDVNAHDWRSTTPLLRSILQDTGKFEVRVTEEFRGAGPETLAPYDLVVLNYFGLRKPELRWGQRADNALLEFLRSGKGVVVFHFSTAAFSGWEEYEKLCGGNWRRNNGHHSPSHDFTVDIKDADHPITHGLKSSFPVPNDELYANLKWQPEGSYHVLATAWDDHSLYKKARQPIPGPGLHHPILWTVNYGKGRVFATVLGHTPENLKVPAFRVTYARGAEWAATGKVTLPIPAEMAN